MKQIQPMKGRPATKIEGEMVSAIASLQDQLHEARQEIRRLTRALVRFRPINCSCKDYPGDEYCCQAHGGDNSTKSEPYETFGDWAAANNYDLDDDQQRGEAIKQYGKD